MRVRLWALERVSGTVVRVCEVFLVPISSGWGSFGLVGVILTWAGIIFGAGDKVVRGPSRKCPNDLCQDCGSGDQGVSCLVEGKGGGETFGFCIF